MKEKNVPQEKCIVPGCERPVKYRKHMLCNAHVVRFYRKGTPGRAGIRARRNYKAYVTNGVKDDSTNLSGGHDAT